MKCLDKYVWIGAGERQAAVEKKLEFLRMMSQLQTTRDSLILDNELYDIVGQRV